MRKLIQFAFVALCLNILISGCELEKTEYKSIINDDNFYGFAFSSFILHSKSISYYSPEENRVFSDLYRHRNGINMRNGIHSFEKGFYNKLGLISFENDDVIEWVDMVNFISEGFLEIDHPRYITPLYSFYLISYGDRNGGIAVVDVNERKIAHTIKMGIETGKVSTDNEYFYVFCDGNNMDDSLIYQLYESGTSALSIHKIDSFAIGIRPVDGVNINIQYEEYSHKGLAILCKGNVTVPASIVVFDLITRRIKDTFVFDPDFKPENLFWLSTNQNQRILVSYINSKLYSLKLQNPVGLSTLIDKNVSQLVSYGNYYIGVSRDTTENSSYLYRFDPNTFETADSLSIDPKALKIAGQLNQDFNNK